MQSYTNVVFNRYEQQILEQATLHMGVAFPKVHEPLPKKQEGKRTPDQNARILIQLVRDPTQGTYDNVATGLWAVGHLIMVLAQEAKLDFWLDDTEAKKGHRPAKSDEPTSPYQQLNSLAEIRQGQLKDALRAFLVLREAARVTVRRTPTRLLDDDEEFLVSDTGLGELLDQAMTSYRPDTEAVSDADADTASETGVAGGR